MKLYAEISRVTSISAPGGRTIIEQYTSPGDNHTISNSFGQAMTRTILFFDRYLKEQE
jgi:hypothetical protein